MISRIDDPVVIRPNPTEGNFFAVINIATSGNFVLNAKILDVMVMMAD